MAEKYVEGIGRRKTASARVRLVPAKTLSIEVNGVPFATYFPLKAQQLSVLAAFSAAEDAGTYAVTAKVHGSGLSAQADAVRHGIARALTKTMPSLRTTLKRARLLTRDPRAKERKKPGLKKARKSSQWSKR